MRSVPLWLKLNKPFKYSATCSESAARWSCLKSIVTNSARNHYATAGLTLTARDIAHADLARAALYRRMVELFKTFDLLVTPTVIVPPFDVRQRHVMEVEGIKMPDFFAWLRLTLAITVTSCP